MQDGGGCMGGEQTLAQANDAVLLAARGCLGLVTSSCIWYYSDSNLWDSNRFLYSSADKNYTGSTQLGMLDSALIFGRFGPPSLALLGACCPTRRTAPRSCSQGDSMLIAAFPTDRCRVAFFTASLSLSLSM